MITWKKIEQVEDRKADADNKRSSRTTGVALGKPLDSGCLCVPFPGHAFYLVLRSMQSKRMDARQAGFLGMFIAMGFSFCLVNLICLLEIGKQSVHMIRYQVHDKP